MSRRLMSAVAVSMILVALAAAGCQRASGASDAIGRQAFQGGGDFTLTDHNGQPFELSSLRGHIVLVFFGFTTCPDACPATLSKLTSVIDQLGAGGSNIKTAYITIDPEHDTPAALKATLKHFKLDAVGLTGTRAEIDKVVAQYGAVYQITPASERTAGGGVTHTTTIYVLDKEGRMTHQFRSDTPGREITATLSAMLGRG